jgi:HK97 family phage prohead protease
MRDKPKDAVETRSCTVRVEVRAKGDQASRTIGGHAAVFNQITDLVFCREQVAPGAFLDHLATDPDVRVLWNHNPDYLLGRTRNGTLRLSEDNIGLAFEADLPKTKTGDEVLILVREGYLTEMSFRFRMVEEKWDWDKNLRTLVRLEVVEVSPVTFPAYSGTDVATRSMAEHTRREEAAAKARRRKYFDMRLRLLTLGS